MRFYHFIRISLKKRGSFEPLNFKEFIPYKKSWKTKAAIHPAAAVTGRPSLKKDATRATIDPAKAEANEPVE